MTPAPFINLLPINQREHPFMGRSASGWWRPARLGQISGGGMFMGPGNIFAQMPVGYFAAPSGAPLMTPEIRNPEHFQDEQHCYRCPDGSHRAFRFGDRDTALAMGCEVTNYENCAGAPPGGALYGRGRMGQQAPAAVTPEGGASIFVKPAVYGVPIIPVLIALGLAALIFSVTRKS